VWLTYSLRTETHSNEVRDSGLVRRLSHPQPKIKSFKYLRTGVEALARDITACFKLITLAYLNSVCSSCYSSLQSSPATVSIPPNPTLVCFRYGPRAICLRHVFNSCSVSCSSTTWLMLGNIALAYKISMLYCHATSTAMLCS
jgi:hypothetical protein